jgi:plasmid stabilization system protein ParE
MIQVDFARYFRNRLDVLQEFFLTQDIASAATRAEELTEEILRFVDLVKLHPKIGRPAALLSASSLEGRRRLETLLRLASEANLPELREYVLRSHLILYAHSDKRILFLSIRHQRELGYVPEAE